MPKKAKAAVVRQGAQSASVYNEGLCVYVYDEGHTGKIREMLASKKYGAAEPDAAFFENLGVPNFASAIAKNRLALAYELRQDDEITVEVAVGPALTKRELAVARWFPPQLARLHLPTGRLRIDTPNTMPLDPEEPENKGAVVSVAPGDYVVSLYRIDPDEMRRNEIKSYKGPEEFILLTPAARFASFKYTNPILPYPEPEEDRSWVGAYSISKAKIDCQINFWDYWDWFRVNLDRKAARKLGLEVGSVLRVVIGKMTLDAVYIDNWKKDDYLTQFGREAFDAAVADRAEVAIGGWSSLEGVEVLGFFRYKAGKAAPEKFLETWTAGSATVLEQRLAPPSATAVEAARLDGRSIRACVTNASATTLVVNITEELVAKLGKKPGDLLQIEMSGGTHTIAYDAHNERARHTLYAGNMSDFQLVLAKKMRLHFFVAASTKLSAAAKKDMNLTMLPRGERRPLYGYFPPETSSPLSKFLHLQPTYVDGNEGTFDWKVPPEVGSAVVLKGVG